MDLGQYTWDPEGDLIAHGAFAEVFKAKDNNATDRYVALKIYKESVAKGTTTGDSLQKKYSLEREFAQIDSLSHTNIISFYGLNYIHHEDMMGRNSSYPVIVMELATEGTLVDFMKTNPDRPTVVKLIQDMIKGVDYLHAEGMVHRDLKPGNVLVTRNRKGEPVAKITDFGISRDLLTDKSIEQSMTEGVGTPHYMAPEQFFKKNFGLDGEISERTDVWGLGVVIYWMLTGKLPFGHDSKDYDLIREHIVNEPPNFDAVPIRYVNLVKACLQKKAEDRVAGTNELYQMLPEVGEASAVNMASGGHRTAIVDMPTSLSGKGGDEKTSYGKDRVPATKGPVKDPAKRKRNRILIVVLTVILLSSVSYFGYGFYMKAKVQGLLDSAWTHYSEGRSKEAYQDYLEASKFESPEAYYHLSRLLQIGAGTEKDLKKSRELARKAIELDYNIGAFNLGWALQKGEGVPIDTVQAQQYFKQSLPHIQELSDANNADAQNLLGLLYYYGYAVPQDYDLSFEVTKKAAEQGHPSGMANLASTYRFGQGIEKDYDKSREWFEKAAKVNSARGHYGLGNLFFNAEGVKQDYEKAFNHYKQAADLGNADAQNSVGYMYGNGFYVEKSDTEATWWYRKAAEEGQVTAQTNVGLMYERSGDYTEALKWYSTAANNNSLKAMYNKADLFQKKLDNYDSAYYWHIKAANANYVSAQFRLGYNYSNGIGKGVNIDSAVYWYSKASELSSVSAQNNLGVLYKNGKGGLQRNYGRALELFKESAEGNSEFGQYNLAEAYYYGQGVTKNYPEAIKYYKQAADQGHASSLMSLGYMYENAQGTSANNSEALRYYRAAANKGNATGTYRLGRMYELGKGVNRDYARAVKEYRKAADKNLAIAQFALGLMYKNGKGVSENLYTARRYYKLAANQGNTLAQVYLGDMYAAGKGGGEDYSKARYWYEKGAAKKNSWAQYKLGLFHYAGLGGLTKSKSKSKALLRSACDQNQSDACDQYKKWF